ncbi:hypothetical protein EYC84_004814 [Monilinia fructicola]|uniref:Protein artemis n=1 Tax=Monilinia fructicola TaxID=38448 RepID=A0A5M9K2E1_MONFR|nr:hypothetical protein EYC84_004814 [Monilinia fructicola]
MSTFNGYIPEFPDIRVDHFRNIPGRSAPLACFLSHVHSDHLDGLDNDRIRLPFVYCSAATKEILVRLEKRRDRLNLAKGILEKEKKTYKHLKRVLKPIPLETPTLIELAPRNEVRITLFDANHCTGAVMFFGMKTIDCIYLDTSNTGPMAFPTKSDGLKELIGKVRKYPPDTKFHFSAWTFGYEDVWAALSRTLDSQIHVDKYKIKLYQSLRQEVSDGQLHFLAPEGPVLAGCIVGNSPKEGCLTTDKDVRIHSCEKGMGCSAYEEDDVVLIRPIITRLPSGVEVAEVGIGGGWGDLVPSHEVAMDPDEIKELLEIVFAETDKPTVEDIRRMLLAELSSNSEAISLDGIPSGGDHISLKHLGESLLRKLAQNSNEEPDERRDYSSRNNGLPKLITFPYSRHSSYPELLDLVKIFKPKDVYPCTVDEEGWHEGLSMEKLFGNHCSASIFRHDSEMRHLVNTLAAEKEMTSQQTQTTVVSRSSSISKDQSEEFTLIASRWAPEDGPSTPFPDQKNFGTPSGKLSPGWSEEIITSPPAPTSQKGVASTDQALDLATAGLGPSSSSQTLRRRPTIDMMSPPQLKRFSAAGSEQQSLAPDDNSIRGGTDLRLPLKTLVALLGNAPALCNQAIIAFLALSAGDIGVETYIAQALPVLGSMVKKVDQLVSPMILSGLHMTMRTLSKQALDSLLEFQTSVDADSIEEIDPDLYTDKLLSPLQFLDREFRQAISLLHSMSELSQPEVSSDTEDINNQDGLTLVKDRELAGSDYGDNGSDYPTDNDHSSSGCIELGIHDPIDNILRCTECNHEIWEHKAGTLNLISGFCTGCDRGASPFYEEFDFPGAFPRIYENGEDESEAEPEEARALIGQEHLDYQSSAYDTQDEDSQIVLTEEYEMNSFIDDDEVFSDSGSDTSNDGSKVDYKSEFEKLQQEHANLRADYFDLVDEYSQFKHDMLGTTEEEDEDQDDEMEDVATDETGTHIVDVVVAHGDRVVTDAVISTFRAEEENKTVGNTRLGEQEGEGEGEGEGEVDDTNEPVVEKLDGIAMVAMPSTFSRTRGDIMDL